MYRALFPVLLAALSGCTTAVSTTTNATLTGLSTWAGECIGECVSQLRFEGESVSLVVEDWDGTLYADSRGTLTAAGLDRVQAVEAELAAATPDAVYGCPDCDDGGGATVSFTTDTGELSSDYPAGEPPTVLQSADTLKGELLEALRSGSDTDLITIDTSYPPAP